MTAMGNAIDVRCPACGHLTQVPAESVGRQARCRCGFTFVIPRGELSGGKEHAFEVDAEAAAAAVVAEEAPGLDGSGPTDVDDAVHSTYQPGSTGNASARPAVHSAWHPEDDPAVLPEICSLLDPDEEVLYSETAVEKAVHLRVVAWGVSVGAPLLLMTLPSMVSGDGGGVCMGVTWLGFLGIVLVVKYLGGRARFYVITDQRTVVREGLLLKRISLVPHYAMLTISVETGLVARWSATRSVRLCTATAGWRGGGVLLADIAQADRVVALLDQARENREDLL